MKKLLFLGALLLSTVCMNAQTSESVSYTHLQAHLDAMGVSKESGESRDRGYVEYEGIQFKDVPNFYGTVGGLSLIHI